MKNAVHRTTGDLPERKKRGLKAKERTARHPRLEARNPKNVPVGTKRDLEALNDANAADRRLADAGMTALTAAAGASSVPASAMMTAVMLKKAEEDARRNGAEALLDPANLMLLARAKPVQFGLPRVRKTQAVVPGNFSYVARKRNLRPIVEAASVERAATPKDPALSSRDSVQTNYEKILRALQANEFNAEQTPVAATQLANMIDTMKVGAVRKTSTEALLRDLRSGYFLAPSSGIGIYESLDGIPAGGYAYTPAGSLPVDVDLSDELAHPSPHNFGVLYQSDAGTMTGSKFANEYDITIPYSEINGEYDNFDTKALALNKKIGELEASLYDPRHKVERPVERAYRAVLTQGRWSHMSLSAGLTRKDRDAYARMDARNIADNLRGLSPDQKREAYRLYVRLMNEIDESRRFSRRPNRPYADPAVFLDLYQIGAEQAASQAAEQAKTDYVASQWLSTDAGLPMHVWAKMASGYDDVFPIAPPYMELKHYAPIRSDKYIRRVVIHPTKDPRLLKEADEVRRELDRRGIEHVMPREDEPMPDPLPVQFDELGGDTKGEAAPEEVPDESPAPAPLGPRIVINPTTFRNKKDALCVAFNEGFRILMEDLQFNPFAEPTDEQREFFERTAYADDENQLRRTILARICTLDTSVPNPTDGQLDEAVEFLETVHKSGACQTPWEENCVSRLAELMYVVRDRGANGTPPPPVDGDMPGVSTQQDAGGGATEETEDNDATNGSSGSTYGQTIKSFLDEQPQAEQPQGAQPEQPQAEQPQAEQPQAEQPQAEQPQAEQPQATDTFKPDPLVASLMRQNYSAKEAAEIAKTRREKEAARQAAKEQRRNTPGSIEYRGVRHGGIENDIVDKNSPGSIAYKGVRHGGIENDIVDKNSPGSIAYKGVRHGGIENGVARSGGTGGGMKKGRLQEFFNSGGLDAGTYTQLMGIGR